MSREFLCITCRDDQPGRRMLFAASREGPEEWGRFVVGIARKPQPEQRVIKVNGEAVPLVLDVWTCDGCGATIRPGDRAGTRTVWMPDDGSEPPVWETEYLEPTR